MPGRACLSGPSLCRKLWRAGTRAAVLQGALIWGFTPCLRWVRRVFPRRFSRAGCVESEPCNTRRAGRNRVALVRPCEITAYAVAVRMPSEGFRASPHSKRNVALNIGSGVHMRRSLDKSVLQKISSSAQGRPENPDEDVSRQSHF